MKKKTLLQNTRCNIYQSISIKRTTIQNNMWKTLAIWRHHFTNWGVWALKTSLKIRHFLLKYLYLA